MSNNYKQDPELHAFRAELDELDTQIVTLLVKRYGVAADVLKWKHKNKLPLHAPEREWRNYQRAIKIAHDLGFQEDDFLRALYFIIITHPFKKYYEHLFFTEV